MRRKKQLQNNQRLSADQVTFLAHLEELKTRFFWIALFFTFASVVAYPFFPVIIKILTQPLGDQTLYYMTPAGGLSFILKVCFYIGALGALPAVIYHLYKFIAPVMNGKRQRSVVIYTLSSILLACIGILFAYFVSLPAALHFLTGFNLDKVSAMLTADSYLSFIISYLFAGALLFQLPLIILIINSITPLKPKRLLSFERHIIVGAFIFGAVLSPTPDVVNQTLLAAPIIIMYQLSVLLVWFHNRGQTTSAKTPQLTKVEQPQVIESIARASAPINSVKPQRSIIRSVSNNPIVHPRTIDVMRVRNTSLSPQRNLPPRRSTTPIQPPKALNITHSLSQLPSRPVRAIDGFMVRIPSSQ